MNWQDIYREKLMSPEDAVKLIESGDRIFAGGAGCLPVKLIDAMCARDELRDIKIVTCMNGLDCRCIDEPEFVGRIDYHSMFLGTADRRGEALGTVAVNSVQYHQATRAAVESYGVNTLMLQVSEPDKDGYLYYGTRGVAWSLLAERVDKLLFQINKYQQRTKGPRCRIHVSQADVLCRGDMPLPNYSYKKPTELDGKIASHILPHIHAGDALQIGIGGIPNAVAFGLSGLHDLRIYTEVLTESQMHLMRTGAVDLRQVDAGFALGSVGHIDEDILEHVNFVPMEQLNDPYIAGSRPRLKSVNACFMADLTGQICAENINGRQYSGVGGQLDFVRAAAISEGGQSFLCLNSTYTAADGSVSSNIKAVLPAGAVVTTPRTDVMNVVTEWGLAQLHNRPFEERVAAMIEIAHPDFRRGLADEAISLGLIRPQAAHRLLKFA